MKAKIITVLLILFIKIMSGLKRVQMTVELPDYIYNFIQVLMGMGFEDSCKICISAIKHIKYISNV